MNQIIKNEIIKTIFFAEETPGLILCNQESDYLLKKN